MGTTGFNIEFVEHLGYYIPKSAMDGFDPETYFDSPILDAYGICSNEKCQKLGFCRLKKKRTAIKKLGIDNNQLSFHF